MGREFFVGLASMMLAAMAVVFFLRSEQKDIEIKRLLREIRQLRSEL